MAKHKQSKTQTNTTTCYYTQQDALSDNESTSSDEDRMDQEPTEQEPGIAKTSKITPKTTKIPPLVVNTTTLKQEHKNELVNNIKNLKLNIKIKYSSDNITIYTHKRNTTTSQRTINIRKQAIPHIR